MATINKNFVPIEAIHPTELIKDELKARGMQNKELAERLGMKAPNLSRFLKSKDEITSAMALKLEEALGIPADYWLGLQLSYDRDLNAIRKRNEEEASAIQIEAVLTTIFNLTFLFKRLRIAGNARFIDKLNLLYKLFNVTSMEGLIALSTVQQGCFKKSDKLETEDKNLKTWILLARYACGRYESDLPPYAKGNESLAAEEIASMTNAQTVTENDIKDIFQKNGIGYCVVEKIEKAPVDAYSTIINGHPFVVASHRRDNMDMLVFDILHECGHINKHLVEGKSIVSYNQNLNEASGMEKEANAYAMDMLIPPHIWKNIMDSGSKSINPYTLIRTVTTKAEEKGISPTIAAWRFKYESKYYKIPGYKSQPIR